MNDKVKLVLSLAIGAIFSLVTLVGSQSQESMVVQLLTAALGGAIGFGITYYFIGRLLRQ